MKRVLTIAHSDSSAASGVQMDLRVFAACGVQGACAVTLLAAQDTFAVRRVFQPPPGIVGAQIDAVVKDAPVDACKVGWLRAPEMAGAVAARIGRRGLRPVVLDPCLWSERGAVLTPPRTVKRLVRDLLPCATVLTVTPRELGILAGVPAETPDERRIAVDRLLALGVENVVVEDPWLQHAAVVWDVEGARPANAWVAGPEPLAGEGGIFSAALAAGLARGMSVAEASRFAVGFVMDAAQEPLRAGKGLPVARIGVEDRRLSP